MVCVRPLYFNEQLSFPCGKCIACRIQRTQEWSTRIIHETSEHKHSAFVTLTYNDESLPQNMSLKKSDLQKFFKRLRRDIPIKYYACGEYGDLLRPHYHAIIFGLAVNQTKLIEENWPFGHVMLGTATTESARYVAGYIQKKLYGKLAYTDKENAFQIQSQGIGLAWASKHQEQIQENQTITVQGVPMGIPRYYIKKLGLDLSEASLKLDEKSEEKIKNYLAKAAKQPQEEIDIFSANLKSKRQDERNLEAMTLIYKKEKKLS